MKYIMLLLLLWSTSIASPSCSQLQGIADIYAESSFNGDKPQLYYMALYVSTIDIMDNYGCAVADEDFELRDTLERVLEKVKWLK